MNRDAWLQVFKIGIGSAIAILLAECLSLSYATSAGIVTLLTIQNTKKDTFHLARKRIVSFGVTMVIAFVCVNLIPLQFVSYGIFMIVLVAVSYQLEWNAAISVNAVLGTHIIFVEQALTAKVFLNEAAIVLIGIVIAILFNMRMHDKEEEIQMDIAHVEAYMEENLHSIADHLCSHSKLQKDKQHLVHLLEHISRAIEKAYLNRNNSLKSHADYYIHYLDFRKEQCEILLHVYYIAAHHEFVVEEAAVVAELIREIADNLHVQKEIKPLKAKIDHVTQGLLHGAMPKDHHELESKAVLYQVANELREFVWHHEDFVENVTEEQILAYWD